ncbi:MAG: hypothetical protein AB8B74_00650 [Crocinitomicaceae bacterium]
MKVNFLHGIVAGLLSAIAGIVYLQLYQNLNFVDFSLVINIGAIAGSSIIGCILMALGYVLLDKIKKPNLKGIMNLLIMILSFLSILGPIMMTLPLEVDFPELFPGLVIPMHFFPAMIFFGLAPFFKSQN